MDLSLDEQDLEFRDELEEWLLRNPPTRRPDRSDDVFPWRVEWQRSLASGNWASPHWPAAHGGRDATLAQVGLYYESLASAGAPLPANVVGLLCGGPTVIDLGTDSQRERYLSAIVDASEIWCQGFSEPSVGSDLARLRTRAERDGDGWRIHGQKVWTTEAHNSKGGGLLPGAHTSTARLAG
jgi:alkylation response protein AidB-like acyl-CoA dehydrogenase